MITAIGSQVLLLVVVFFGEPIFYVNATPFMSVEGCMESGKVLNIPDDDRIKAHYYCKWYDAVPEAMPVLTQEFSDGEMEILRSIGWGPEDVE